MATQLKAKAKNNSTTYIDVDRDEVDESLLGAFAVVIPAGDPDDVTSAVAGAAAVNAFLAIGSVLLGTVRDLDLDVEIGADLLDLGPAGSHDGPVMSLVNDALDGDLVLQVVDDLQNPLASSVNAVLGTLQGHLNMDKQIKSASKIPASRPISKTAAIDMKCVLKYSVSSRWFMRAEAKLVQNFDLAPVAVDQTNEKVSPTISRCVKHENSSKLPTKLVGMLTVAALSMIEGRRRRVFQLRVGVTAPQTSWCPGKFFEIIMASLVG